MTRTCRHGGNLNAPRGRQLQPVSFDDLIGGRWRGGVFQNGHKAISWLREIDWYGKEFVSRSDLERESRTVCGE